MIAIQAFLVIAGCGGLVWAMVAWMVRANRREHEIMARRHGNWMANGSNRDEKPNFFSGNSGG